MIPSSQFNLISFLCLVLEFYNIEFLQIKINYSLIHILHKILIKKNKLFFINKNNKNIDSKITINKVKKCYYFVVNIFQSFLILNGNYIVKSCLNVR